MIKNPNYTFNVTVSDRQYTTKPTSIDIAKIKWHTVEVNTDDLLDIFLNGYSVSNVYNEDNFISTYRKLENYKGSYTVYIDVDETVYNNIDEFVETLTYKPTFAYYSFSDNKEKKGIVCRRFRLCYVFNKMIDGTDNFRSLSKSVLNMVVKDTQEAVKDTCTLSPNQYMNGTDNKEEFYTSYYIYSQRDFNDYKISDETEKVQSRNYIRKKDNIIESHLHFYNEDSEFIKDYWNLPFSELIYKYRTVYEYFDHTPLPTVDDDTKFIVLPSDYVEIKRYWILDKGIDDKGESHWVQSFVRRVKDGEGRKRKLFLNGCYRRKMLPNITFEHLLYCLVYELHFYMENTKDVITNDKLFKITLDVMKCDYTVYTKDMKHPNFIVNPNYCLKYGLTKNQVSKMARKELNYMKIGSLYDCMATDKENLRVLKENGVKCSLRTLQNFKKENGLQKNKKKCK